MEQKLRTSGWDRIFEITAYVIGIGAIVFTVIMILLLVLKGGTRLGYLYR